MLLLLDGSAQFPSLLMLTRLLVRMLLEICRSSSASFCLKHGDPRPRRADIVDGSCQDFPARSFCLASKTGDVGLQIHDDGVLHDIGNRVGRTRRLLLAARIRRLYLGNTELGRQSLSLAVSLSKPLVAGDDALFLLIF